MWLLDELIFTLNVASLGLLVLVATSTFTTLRRAADAWREHVPAMPAIYGAFGAAVASGLLLAIYWGGYRLFGFPMWMRWLAG